MRGMSRIRLYLVMLFGFAMTTAGFSEDAGSELFVNTVKRLVRKKVKENVLKTMPPLTSVIAADLIEQVINGSSRDAVAKSAMDVGIMMVFMHAVRQRIVLMVDEHPELIDSAGTYGFNREQFIGYSCLYYYYSERMKYGFCVSKEILRLSEEKKRIDSIKTKNNKKWIPLLSKELITLRRKNFKYIYDVRINELLRYAVAAVIDKKELTEKNLAKVVESTFDEFRKKEKEALYDHYGLSDESVSGDPLAVTITFFREYEASFKNAFTDTLQIETVLFQPLRTLFHHQYQEPDRITDNFYQAAFYLMEQMLKRVERKKHGFEYIVSLAGSVLADTDVMDFNSEFFILDQFRYYIAVGDFRLFVFTGGFLDPIIRTISEEDDTHTYLTGAGVQFKKTFIAAGCGIPYPEFGGNSLKVHLTIGYEIPIREIFE